MTSSGDINSARAREELIRARLAGRRGGAARISPADRTGPLPLAYGQQQMWFLNRLETGSPEYLVPMALRLTGPLDAGRLGAAWAALVDRHEIMRTRYALALMGDTPVQVVDASPAPAPLPVTDLTAVPADQREARAVELVERAAATPFDLAEEWPARASLIRLDAEEHVLVVVMHHIACDAWSMPLLTRDLAAFYAGTVPAPLPVQYADYAAWERGPDVAPVHERHLGYWRDELADLTPVDLPTDRPRAPVRDWHGDVVDFQVPAAVAEGLAEVGRGNDATLFMVLMTAFQALLSRYTGQSDVPVGTMVSGRTRPELQDLIGYGIHSLVVRTRWEGDPAFTEMLSHTRTAVLGAFDHQDVPFARLVEELQPERDMSRTPLFQVALTLQDARPEPGDFAGLRAAPLVAGSRVSRFDLTALFSRAADGTLNGHLEYATALFDRSTVERMAGHLTRLLTHVAAAPESRVSALEILDAAERELLTAPADSVSVVGRRVHELFAERAAATPDAVALVAGEVCLSYRELDERANRIAHHLRAVGVGGLVGVCLERGADLIPVLLGVLKAGAGYLPLDPAQPVDRLGFMLDDAQVSVVVASRELAGSLETVFSGLIVHPDAVEIAAAPSADPGVSGSVDDLIYVIYTSGSTGRPKGVCLTHRNVARLMAVGDRHYGFGAGDVWPLFHSFAFDVSVWEMWGALLFGGTLVVVPQAVTRNPDEFVDLMVEQGVTVLNQTPTAFRSLVAMAGAGDPRLDELRLRAVIFAGEKLDIPALAPWVDRFGLDRPGLYNMYGITETTVHTTFYRVVAEDLVPGAPNRVGVPLADLSVHLLDGHGQLVPIGVAGEIHVGGPGVASGYLNRPELTAQRFVPDPFGGPGERLYRSGDIARRRLDGSLEFVGRIDDQVKIRGFRVELGEIEAALAAVDGVREARVLVRGDVLVAYLTADGELPGPAELRAVLSVGLPEYMIPAAFVPLDGLPLTVNGKLDRRALPAPDAQALPTGAVYVAARTPDEERIAGIWAEVLGVERVGVHDSFFDLGGHSIRAVTLVGALRGAGYPAAVRDVFSHRTVAELTEALGGREALTAEDDRPVAPYELISAADRELLPVGVVDAYPMSRVQAGMVVEMLADADLHAYHNVTSFRIRDDLPFSVVDLRAAVDLVVARHEVLRTSIHLNGYSQPLQLVHESAVLPVGVRELRDLDETAVEAALREFTARERATLFDLRRPPLLRLHAHVCDDKTWWLSVTECHPIIEGWSHHSLLMEVLEYYRTLRRGEKPAPEPLPELRYADFIAAELRALESESDRSYWRDIVTRHAPFELPGGWGAEGTSGPRSAHVTAVTYLDLEDRLRELARAADVPMKSVLLAAHLTVLGQLTLEESFHTGVVLHGRPDVTGAERVYGMYLNTLPIGFRRGAARTWRQVVADVFAAEAGMWQHRQYPMPAIAQEFGDGRRLYDTMFIYLDFDQVDRELVDYLSSIDDSPTEFPLSVSVRVGHVGLAVDTRVISPMHAERIAGMYRAVLEAMAAGPDGDATGTYLPPGERELLTAPADSVSVVGRRVHELFAERAAATPDAVALVAGEVCLSYRELDERANRIAHHLRAVGVGGLVGVCLERGADLIPVLLGVLKAGAGYLPLDPAQPVDRLGFMLDDAQVSVVVASRELAGSLETVFSGLIVHPDAVEIAAAPSADPGVSGSVDDLIYVIYTSGSTGRPKGVCLTHRNVARLMAVGDRHYGFGAGDVWPLFHSFAFDVSVWEMWGALLFGGTLVVVPQAVTRNPDEFVDLMVEQGVTVLNQTPTAFRSLVAMAGAGDPRLDELRLRAVIFAGEKLDIPALAPWVDRFGLDRPGLYNMYGITETTVHTTFYRVVAEDLVPGAPNRVGVPLADLSVHLLDGHGQLVPIGVAGEIHVGGPGVASGYLNRPELTAQRFVPDPFGGPGERLYRSGDIARRRLDGSLEFVGRIDDQVKIRGFRVELGEIEAALAAVDGVREARVLVRGDVLVAYLTADGELPGPAELRAVLSVGLPEYMIPAAFVPLDGLPLTVNGKLDRRALPAPDAQALPTGAVYVAARTPDEERIAGIWAEVLGVERVGVHDSFFDLGGHSIRAVTLVGALRGAGYPAAVRDVLTGRTVARLVELLAERHGTSTQVPAVAPFELISAADRELLPVGVVDAYPMSRVQAGMVVEMLADRERNAYHVVTSFRLRDGRAFSLPALRAAAGIAADRHELLRTSLELTGYSEPMQLVHGDVQIPITVRDLRGLSPAEREREVRDFTAREQNDPFDVAVAPLMRLTVHVETDETWWLTVAVCHPVTEGWSHRAMLVEMLDNYARSRDGEPLRPYEHPPVRYADFIAAEQRAIASIADREHWRSVVDNHDPMRLPAGWGDEEGTGSFSVTVPWGDLERELRELASATQTSLKAVLHAAHLTVLSRLTEAERFHTGLVFSARPEAPGADRVYGMYLNILPFGFDRTARTWSELIRAVYEQEAAAWPHRCFPMPVIQRELTGGERLYDVRFSYQEDFEEVDTDLIDVENGLGDGASEFPLAVAAVGGGLVLTMERRSISRINADRLASMYRAVLESMAADTDGDARAAFLPDGELRRLLVDYNRTSPAPVTRTVLDMFEAQAAATPDATAVNAADRRLTYAELDALANRYAHHLRANGVRREAGAQPVVGLLLDRGADLVAALLGVWKAGAAYVPLDPAHPADRLRYMLANAGAALVVTQSRHADEFAGAFDGPVVRVDTAAAEIAARPATPVDGGSDLDELAYVIYTSGSTGRPKGVQVPHRGLANHIQWAAAELAGRGTTGAPLFSSIAFDLPVPNLYGPLVTGQPVHLFPAGSDLDDLGEWLARTGPFSFIKLTPGHLDVLSHQLSPAQAGGLAPVIVVAGEAFTRRTLERWRALDNTAALINEYGPTEASVGTCIQPVSSAQPADVVPIGRPLPGMTMYVLDHLMRPVPVGVPGELYVGGTGVARGYASRPDLTAERFLPDPFARKAGMRLYRTGDLVRMLPDGAVAFLGRLDDQVKVRGYRIELGEIKSVLVAHPAVRDAVVVTRDTGNGEVQLVAYCVPAGDGGELSVAALTEHSRARLPEYMVPTAYVPIEQIPLTANGKVDQRALPDPTEAASTGPEFVGPRTPTETAIAEIWCTVLGLERVGVHDRFFALGGHSILMIQVLAAARKAGLNLTVAHMYQHETIAELAAVLDGMSLDPPAVPPSQAPAATEPEDERSGPTTLTPIQRRFLTLPGDANRYVQAALLEVRPAVDPELLGAALRALADHHDSLRLRVDGDEAAIADTTPTLRVVDLGGQGAQERESAVRRIVDEAADGHDITAGRMMLATLLRGATGDGDRLLLSVHHLAVDIVSWSILLADLNDAYAALEAGRPVELPPRTTSFRRWAGRLAAHVADGGLAAQVPFWLNRMPAPQLPVDHPDGADTSADTRTVTVVLPRHLTATLTHDLPASGQTRSDEVVYAALAMAVTGWAGGNRAAFDVEGHGREPLFDDVDTSRTVGWFTSLYPVSLWLPGRREPDAMLRSVRDQLRAIPDRGIGYGMLRYLSPDPDVTAALEELPPAQILVNYIGHRAVGTPSGKGPDGGRPAGPRFSLPPQQLVSRHEPDRPRTHPDPDHRRSARPPALHALDLLRTAVRGGHRPGGRRGDDRGGHHAGGVRRTARRQRRAAGTAVDNGQIPRAGCEHRGDTGRRARLHGGARHPPGRRRRPGDAGDALPGGLGEQARHGVRRAAARGGRSARHRHRRQRVPDLVAAGACRGRHRRGHVAPSAQPRRRSDRLA